MSPISKHKLLVATSSCFAVIVTVTAALYSVPADSHNGGSPFVEPLAAAVKSNASVPLEGVAPSEFDGAAGHHSSSRDIDEVDDADDVDDDGVNAQHNTARSVHGDHAFVEAHQRTRRGSEQRDQGSFGRLTLAANPAKKEDVIVITRGPYLQQVGRTSAIVVWETDEPVMTRLLYEPRQGAESIRHDSEPKRRHVVKLENLRPGMGYEYAIELAGDEGTRWRFRTEGGHSSPFRIAVFGDTRTGHRDHGDVIQALMAEKPALALHTGDLVGVGSSPRQWDNFFAIEQPLLSMVPLYPTLGNHEENGELYLQAFELPADAPHAERYYTFSYATAWFAVLDVYASGLNEGGAQIRWLQQELEKASTRGEIRHRIVVLHHGPFDSGMHGSNADVRERLVPLFERYGVSIVFSGHNHHYERSTVAGIKYVVTGGSGAPLRSVQGGWWTQKMDSVLHYIIMDVEGPWARFQARHLDGEQFDVFELGSDVYECESANDCTAMAQPDCELGTEVRWTCVRSGCIPDCEPTDHEEREDDGQNAGLTWE